MQSLFAGMVEFFAPFHSVALRRAVIRIRSDVSPSLHSPALVDLLLRRV